MANEYAVNAQDLLSVAQAIREKGGTTETLSFPDGFIGAVEDIETGSTMQIIVSVESGTTVTATKGELVVTGVSQDGTCTLIVPQEGVWTVQGTKDRFTTGEKDVEVKIDYPVTISLFRATITVTVDTDSAVTCVGGGETLSAQSTGTVVFTVAAAGEYTVTAEKDGNTTSDVVTIQNNGDHAAITLAFIHIYGAQWDGTSTPVWSRTDEAAGFTNPVPYTAGKTKDQCSSPFDTLYPWKDMKRFSDSQAGELVAIPKFWFKWTKSGSKLKLQIADHPTAGFYVSPAHANRGDGKGERDVVYVGRYQCADDYKSKTGASIKGNITRSQARSGIHNLGAAVWQIDFRMVVTIWMLYLVEFANWNSQACIGYGGVGDRVVGYTDTMCNTYHTGTTQSSRNTAGEGVQYRYIEGLWDNVFVWIDGCYNNSSGYHIISNPASFSDSGGGTDACNQLSGSLWPSAFSVSTVAGLEWFIYPTATGGSESTYSCDGWFSDASEPCMANGANDDTGSRTGLFYVSSYRSTDSGSTAGCRLQKLP